MEQKELNEILQLHERWLCGANGECANLTRANLTGANLYEADLREADLRKAGLCWVDLTRANLIGANLYEADLYKANLTRANLRWVNLTGADLAGANLYEADLRGANFADVIGLSVLCVQVNTSCENRKITYIPSLDVVTAGCFQGTFEEFEKRVEEEHKGNPFVLSRYRRVIAFLKREAEEDEKKLEQKD